MRYPLLMQSCAKGAKKRLNPRIRSWGKCMYMQIIWSDILSSVSVSPRCQLELRDVAVNRRSTVRLSCEMLASPKPSIQWEKDSKLLQECAQIKITRESFMNTLEITETDFDDSGVYTCTATNEIGRVTTSCIVQVRGKVTGRTWWMYWLKVMADDWMNVRWSSVLTPDLLLYLVNSN